MANWTFDPSQYQEKNFELIPVGDYRMRIADVVEKTFKSGNPGYEITMDVSGHASKVWFYLVLDASNSAQTNQRIGEFFDSFDIKGTAMGSGKQWVGAVGAGRIKHDEYNGKTSAKVAYLIARNRQDKLPVWQNTGAQTPNNTAPQAQVEIPSDLPFDMG
jgi:hypothetical protein